LAPLVTAANPHHSLCVFDRQRPPFTSYANSVRELAFIYKHPRGLEQPARIP
jgi:hypothetical protein